MSRKGITVAGSIIADLIYTIETYPKLGRLTNILGQRSYVGGSCNLILDLAKLDPALPVKVSGIVGTDASGDLIINTLSECPNIDMRDITREGDSSITIVMDSKQGCQRTFFYNPVASDKYSEQYLHWDYLDCEIFHLEYLLLMGNMDSYDDQYGTKGARTLAHARARGMKTSIDVVSEEGDRTKRVVVPALQYTDYCTVNETEAEGITSVEILSNGEVIEGHVWQAAHKMHAMGVRSWVVIHTPACAYGLDCMSGEEIRCPSIPLPQGYIRGTTGAGDAFCCGILYAAYQNKPLNEALILAHACAVRSLAGVSGTESMTTFAQIMEDYQKLEACV